MNTDQVMLFTVPGMVVLLFWTVFSTIRRFKIAKTQAQVQMKLLEKFSSGQDLLAYLNSEAGKRFLETTAIEQVRANPIGRILTSVQVGVILAVAGVALFFMGRQFPDAVRGFVAFGTLALALGVGFLLSAGVSYRLSKSFGLLESPSPRGQ